MPLTSNYVADNIHLGWSGGIGLGFGSVLLRKAKVMVHKEILMHRA